MPTARTPAARGRARILASVVAALALLIGGAAAPAIGAEPAGTITGTIRDGDGPRTGGFVSAIDSSTGTASGSAFLSASGGYSLTGLTSGVYRLSYTSMRAGYVAHAWYPGVDEGDAVPVSVTPGAIVTADWNVEPRDIRIAGTVADSVTGAALAGIRIDLHDTGTASSSTWTDADGRFEVRDLHPGDYTLDARDERTAAYTTASLMVTAPEDGVADIAVPLAPKGTISGVLDGASPRNARIWISPVGGGYSRSATVDTDGRFESEPLDAGEYRMHIDSGETHEFAFDWFPGAAGIDDAQIVTVRPGDETELSWTLRTGGVVTGTVRSGEDGRPLPNVTVIIRRDGASDSAVTGSDGIYRLEGLSAGQYALETRSDTRTTVRSNVSVALGETVSRDVSLFAQGRVSGSVAIPGDLDDPGTVQVFDEQLNLVDTASYSKGSPEFTTDLLDAGVYLIRFLAPRGAATVWLGGTHTSATSQRVTVAPGAVTTISQSLPTLPPAALGRIEGYVQGPQGEPIDGVTAELYDEDGLPVVRAEHGFVRQLASTVGGSYSFGSVQPGVYRVKLQDSVSRSSMGTWYPWRAPYDTAWAAGSSDESITRITVAEGGVATASTRLTRTVPEGLATLSGLVTLDGAAYSNARVVVLTTPSAKAGVIQVASGYTGSDGRYTIDGIPPWDYIVWVGDAPWWRFPSPGAYLPGTTAATKATAVRLSADATTVADFTARRSTVTGQSGVVRGRVVAAGGRAPLAGVDVRVSGATSSSTVIRTDPNGYYETDAVPAGPATITLTPPSGYAAPAAQTRTVTTGTFVVAEFVLDRKLAAKPPTLPSTVRVGAAATATTAGWTPGTTFTYQWRRAGAAIAGATKSSYTPTSADRGKSLTVTATGRKAGWTTVSSTSAARTVGYGALTAPAATIGGAAKVGKTLTAVHGTWTARTTFTYQWYRGGVKVEGATAVTYRLTSRDAGTVITVKITGHKTAYSALTRTSAATKRIAR